MAFSVLGGRLEFSPWQVVMLLLAASLVGYGGYDYVQQSAAIDEAVAVNATVTETNVSLTDGRGLTYELVVTYEYRYRGQNYTDDDLFPSAVRADYDSRSDARAVLEPYAENETTTAYVDPASPGDAFLRKETHSGPLVLVGIGAAMVVVGLLRGRQAATTGPSAPAESVGRDVSAPELSVLGVDHERVGALCKRGIAVSFAALWLAVVGIFVAVLANRNRLSPGTTTQIGLFEPIGLAFLAGFLSVCALIASLVAYGVWSYRECRRLRAVRDTDGARGFLVVLAADSDSLDRYEHRKQLTAASLLVAAILVTVMLDILGILDLPF